MRLLALAKIFTPLGGLAVLLVACSSAPEPTDDTTEAQSGCRTICPKCKPNQICPKYACYLDCSSHKPGSCTVSTDCRLFDDYCTGCDCRALSSNEKDPVCSGPGVRCFAQPCLNHTAACFNGTCTVL